MSKKEKSKKETRERSVLAFETDNGLRSLSGGRKFMVLGNFPNIWGSYS